jgi:hypothetical protein
MFDRPAPARWAHQLQTGRRSVSTSGRCGTQAIGAASVGSPIRKPRWGGHRIRSTTAIAIAVTGLIMATPIACRG